MLWGSDPVPGGFLEVLLGPSGAWISSSFTYQVYRARELLPKPCVRQPQVLFPNLTQLGGVPGAWPGMAQGQMSQAWGFLKFCALHWAALLSDWDFNGGRCEDLEVFVP